MQQKRTVGSRLSLSFLLFSMLLGAILLMFGAITHHFSAPDTTDADVPTAKEYTVILDPGHGGEDGGAVGKNGVYEKDLNLAVAQEIEAALEERGISVICTRTEDILLYDRNVDYKGRKKMLDLAARLKVAKDTPDSVFISIHMNSFPQTQYSGLQVYYSGNDPRSAALANLIQNEVRRQLQPENARKTKQASSNIYLLDRITSPAILIECGFLSNAEECERLSTEAYRKELALVLATAIADYVDSLS